LEGTGFLPKSQSIAELGHFSQGASGKEFHPCFPHLTASSKIGNSVKLEPTGFPLSKDVISQPKYQTRVAKNAPSWVSVPLP